MIGQTVSHYKITEKLGEGGMGVVYKARDTKLKREVALKFLPESLTPTSEDRQRFIREAQSAAALSHPNICTIHSIDEHEGTPFIVMEYIEGETLREKIDGGDLTMVAVLDYATRIADALAEAHEQSIIHRDIKPENIMVDTKGRIKVMDFGLAKLKQGRDITKTGDTVGTLAYSSPEQIRGQQVDHRSDLFSLGVVLYEMLTSEKPFRGEHQAAMTYSIVNEEPTPLDKYLPEAPEELERIFGKALAKDPHERFSSASEIVESLEDLKESIDVRTTNVSSTNQSQENKTNSRSTTGNNALPELNLHTGFRRRGLLGGTVLLLVLALLAGWWFIGEEPSPTESRSNISERSVAVLPFSAFGQEDPGPFTEGIHDDLLTRLSNVADLQVISRASVEKYRDTELSPPAIADSLGVRWIVDGRVQETGGQVQVYAQLIDPQTDVNRWADSYQRELTAENLFAIQGDIAQNIAGALQAELSEGEKQRIAGTPTQNLAAYRLYVEGRKQLAQALARDQIVRAASYFGRALEQDSTYALAWAGLADAIGGGFLREGLNPDSIPDSVSLPEVTQMQAARRALELDPDLAEAHAALGMAHYEQRNAPAAIRSLRKAVELRPSYAQAQYGLASVYTVLGRREKALDHLKLAEEINPDHVSARHTLFDAYTALGQPEKALREAREQQREHPYPGAIWAEARALNRMGQHEEAIQIAKERLEKTDSNYERAVVHNHLTGFYAMAGDTVQARRHLKALTEVSLSQEEHSRVAFLYATAYLILGNVDAAIEEFRKQSDWWRVPTNVLRAAPSRYPAIAEDPRYEELIRDLNTYWGLNPDGSLPEESESK